MSVTCYIPLDKVKGISIQAGSRLYTNDVLTVDLQPIPPGTAAKLQIDVLPQVRSGHTAGLLSLGNGHAGNRLPARRTYLTIPIPPGATLATFSNISALTIYSLKLLLDLPEKPYLSPAEIIGLDVYAPAPDSAALHWDTSRWNRKVWNQPAPAPGTFHWNKSTWNTAEWYDSAAETIIWQSLIESALSVTINRSISGLAASANVGILTVELKGQHNDPRTLGISIGAPVRCYLKYTQTLLFTGNLIDAVINPAPHDPRETRVTLTFADAVATLANTTRYGAKADHGDGSETFTARGRRLSKSARNIHFDIDNSNVTIAPTVWETNLAAHFDALTATTGGYWTVTRENRVHVSAAQPATASGVKLSDTHHDRTALKYVGIEETWNTAELVTSIEATTHAAIKTSDGWQAADRSIIVDSPTQAAAWTGSRATVDLLTPLVGSAQRDAASRLLKRAAETPSIQSADLLTRNTTANAYKGIAQLDPAQIIEVARNGENHRLQIKEIEHLITPEKIDTRLTF